MFLELQGKSVAAVKFHNGNSHLWAWRQKLLRLAPCPSTTIKVRSIPRVLGTTRALILQYDGSPPCPLHGSVGAQFLGKYLALEANYAPKNKCKDKRKEKAISTSCAMTSILINKAMTQGSNYNGYNKYIRKGQILNDALFFFYTLNYISWKGIFNLALCHLILREA